MCGEPPVLTVMGEALIDIIIDAEGDVTSVVGGAALNTARAIARLGVPVEYLGKLSSDALGDRIRKSIRVDGINLAVPEPVDVDTTLAIAHISSDGSATYRFLVEGTSVAAVDPQEAVSSVSVDSTFLYVGGIALAVQPSADAAVAVVQGSPAHRLVMLDPNCRPAIAGASQVYRTAFDSLLLRTDLLKVSTDDLAFLFPGHDPLNAASGLREKFDFTVLLTAGADDVWIMSDDAVVRCPVPAIDVVDTVGAGDSFSGGFASWWTLHGLGRDDLRDIATVRSAVEAGITVASMSCCRRGAESPRLEELPSSWCLSQ